jgi:predicted  nucleic acid-binding Zn-ribbon protein
MAKECVKCGNSINDKAFECPFCGNTDFEFSLKNKVIQKENLTNDNNKAREAGIYSDKLESLIDMAVSDGELTEKEKQVLFKKAELEGIDLDEFEMVLDSKLKDILNEKLISTVISTSSISASNTPLNPDRYIELEKLIDIALSDGILSETERDTLINKGISSGIPQGEISMILDSKITEKQKIISQKAAPKSDKYGDVKKCPSCGAIVQSFSAKCSDCGYEYRDIQSDATINLLFEALMEADNIPKEEFKERSSDDGIMGSIFASQKRLQEEEREKKHEKAHREKIHSRKIQIISNFPVPNTKEPLIEFLTLGISKASLIKKGLFSKMTPAEEEHNALVPAWKSKIEQVVMKARMSMKDDKALLAEIENMVSKIYLKK